MKQRVRILYVNEYECLLLMMGRARITNLPEGCAVERVYYSQTRRSFGIFVEHESFDVVDPMCEPPPFFAEVEMGDEKA